jgi:protein-tyrosine phosphatase
MSMARILPFRDPTVPVDRPDAFARAALTTAPARFEIVVVCTGNVARSPLIERLLVCALDEATRARVVVTSAGTRAMVGRPMTDESRLITVFHGADPERFAARQLSEQIVADADLVITASREHRDTVLDLRPGALRRTFTLRELARIATHDSFGSDALREDPVENAHEFVRRASGLRSGAHAAKPSDDDVLDPYGRGAAHYAAMAEQVVPAVRAIASVLGAA